MAIDWDAEVGGPCVAVFGEDATYIPANGLPPYPIVGVFDEAYREIILIDATSPTSDAMPVLGVNDAQFQTDPQQGDYVLIARTGNFYIIKETRPDRHAVTKLMLNATDSPSIALVTEDGVEIVTEDGSVLVDPLLS